jgi:hypothetical protein
MAEGVGNPGPSREETMDESDVERLLAECLEEYHRRRALRESISAVDFEERLGPHFDEFIELLAAESSLDAAMSNEAPAEAFPRPFGAYTLLRELGGGAMGVVYEAMHRDLGRKVALKVLRTGFDTEPLALERFRREARACAQVRHDSIVEIYEAGFAEGRPFYAMPILSGKSLAQLIREGNGPAPKDLCRGLAGIADALDGLHRAGIVHRDIKPGNIMVSPEGKMILADFGLARTAASQALTQTGQALGTPLYMSPEQVIGQKAEIDGRSDIYGLGATMYEALSGKPPFKADGFHSLMRLILTERPPPIASVAPHVPRESAFIAMKAMEREKKDRYQSAAEMKQDLDAFVAGLPVTGRPVARWRVLVRRNRKLLLAAAVLMLALAGAAFLWMHRPATLQLSCFPAARVSVDGRDFGATPARIELPAGQHEVRLAQDGFSERRFAVTLAAGEKQTLENILIAADPDHPEALGLLAKAMDIDLSSFETRARLRGPPDCPDLEVLWPRGTVRAADLISYRIDVIEPAVEIEGTVEFRRGAEVLGRLDFAPERLVTEAAFPADVLAKLSPGDEVEWGYWPREGEPVTARFRLVDEAVGPKLAALEATLKGQTDHLRGHFRAQILLDAGLDLAAFREALRILEKAPKSARALAVAEETLIRMGLADTGPWAEMRSRIDNLSREARSAVPND